MACNQSLAREYDVPSESNDKKAMLDELTTEANEQSFVIVLQHGGNDVTYKRSVALLCYLKKMHSNLQTAFEVVDQRFRICFKYLGIEVFRLNNISNNHTNYNFLEFDWSINLCISY